MSRQTTASPKMPRVENPNPAEPDFTSQHISTLRPSPLALMRNLSFPGKKVINLLSGDVGYEPSTALKEAYVKALYTKGTNKYPPVFGIEKLREKIALYLTKTTAVKFEAPDVVVTAGGQSALYCTHMAILDPGDEVVTLSPYWTPMEMHSKAFFGNLVAVPMDENFEFDPRKLEKAVNEKTKAIYVNSPHNPTGKVFGYEELESIAKIAKKNNLLVISDEPYKSIIFEGEHISMVSLPGMEKHTLIADSFSKDFNITGWRVGYAASKNKKLISRLMTPLVQSINTVSHPAQYALAEVIENPRDKESLQDMRSKMELLVKGLNSVEGINCVRPNGSFYIFPNVGGLKRKFPKREIGEEAFARLKELGITDGFYEHVKNSFSWQLVDYLANFSAEYAVIVAPGKEFGEAFDDYVRLSFASRTGEELSKFIGILQEAFGSKIKSQARPKELGVENPKV